MPLLNKFLLLIAVNFLFQDLVIKFLIESKWPKCLILQSIRTIISIFIVVQSLLYIHNISADASFGPLQVFLVELRSLQGNLNWTLYLIRAAILTVYHNRVQVLTLSGDNC